MLALFVRLLHAEETIDVKRIVNLKCKNTLKKKNAEI